MLRVTTLYASSAAATAGYYTRYLAKGSVSSRARGRVCRPIVSVSAAKWALMRCGCCWRAVTP